MAMVLLWTLLWISGYYQRLSAEMLVQYKYFLSGEGQRVSLQAPAETKGTEFIWEWTSHDESYANARIITIQSDGNYWWDLKKAPISKQGKYDIYLEPKLQNAGVFTFIQTKPEKVKVAQFEVFAAEVKPCLWSIVEEGSDVIMSCEVSHLPDSATLDWERDTEPTANTTLIYNNTAHVIIHSADRYSEGTYNCTLRWNGELIFSIPRTLQVENGTFGTQHTLYRGSLSSSEVVLICHSLVSYRKAYWRWEPLSGTNTIRVASAEKYKNVSISMEIDKERFSSERYDGSNFPLRISPVKFGDSGMYFCYCEYYPAASVTLVTVEISAEPPSGLSRNQSVVLNCEISQAFGNVTLAWLRMKGGRGELVKQEVLSQGHPKKMLSLTLPILSRDQLHWACAVFIESMLRAQVPLRLILPAPITEPEEPKPGWSTETVVRVVIVVLSTLGMLKVLMWYCRRRPAMLVQYKYFLSGEGEGVSLQAPAETNGTEFFWEWTSHDGSYVNARIITIPSDGKVKLNLSITRQGKYDIVLEPKLQNAGVFTFIQTKPEKVNLSQFEVFAVKVKPSRWSSVKEGSDVIRSCEVSHLPDSATLDWERDREPTANTTLIYYNTAHIIIHSADRYSEGTYSCTLRWNGALIFSIPRTLQVYKGTYDTNHTLYRGSLNSSEAVLICRSQNSYYGKAYWRWEPLSGTNAIIVASGEKNENTSISMKIDKERFSSERYDGSNFPLRISPVKFGDSGRYFCHCDAHRNPMATVTLVTVQVSAVPPGGPSRNQSVVLNCEISQVNGSVTLAWLRIKGGRGELVKQEVLSEGHPEKMLSLTLPILSRDQLHWACAVFTESMLRTQVPLHLTLPTPITEPEEPKPDGMMLVIGLACTAAVCVGVLLLLRGLLFRRLKTAAGPTTSPAEGNGAADAVYSYITDLQQGQADGNGESSAAAAVYSNVAELQKDQDPHRQQRRQLNPQSHSEQEENENYSMIQMDK